MQDSLMIIQSVIMFFTGVIVLWYTWETHKMRKDTKEHNKLINQQILLMRESIDSDFKKQMSLYEPVFRYVSSGGDGRSKTTLRFKNEGSQVKDLKIVSEEGCNVSIRPTDVLNDKEEGHIEIYVSDTNRPQVVHLVISYKNKLAMEKQQKFECTLSKRNFHQITE